MSKRTLLLADDSVTIQKVVNLTFADEGIVVITVGDGDAAMEKITEIVPDVVLADVHMPGLNGYQICELLRQNPETKSLPVILLVGSFEPFDEAEAARVGANAYLTKPFQSIRQLVSQVTELIDISPHAKETSEVPEDSEPTIADEPTVEQMTPETSDIEALYEQSFGEQETNEPEDGTPLYVDAGMDDEIIETRHGDALPGAEFPSEPGFSSRPDAVDRSAHAFDAQADGGRGAAVAPAAASDPPSDFDQFSRTEQIPAMEVFEKEFVLDEIELLDLPSLEKGKTLEFATTPGAAAEGSNKQVVSLSPELMDVIVQRVVDKLSEKK